MSVNLETVGIGLGIAILGASTVVGSITYGATVSAATGGIGLCPGIIQAGAGVVAGLTWFAIGMGDIAIGISGGKSQMASTLRALYTPDVSTAVNPF